MNWTGVGVVRVRKLRYRTRSKARTVPSRLALTTACPLQGNDQHKVCSEQAVKSSSQPKLGRQKRPQTQQGVEAPGQDAATSQACHMRCPRRVLCTLPFPASPLLPPHLPRNCTAVTGAWWSEKVTKQKPEEGVHTLTLASSAPVAR